MLVRTGQGCDQLYIYVCAFWRQACGIKYYEDFQHRIPAAEVAAVERLVHEARPMHFLRRIFA